MAHETKSSFLLTHETWQGDNDFGWSGDQPVKQKLFYCQSELVEDGLVMCEGPNFLAGISNFFQPDFDKLSLTTFSVV